MNLKVLFNKQRDYLNFFFDRINLEKTKKILDILENCKNNIIFTGIGKSGFIANKIANTMLSTGTKALYLPAQDALHGDIGIVTKDDIFVVFSKSGETKELLDLIFYVKKRKTKVIAIVSNENSSLIKVANEFIYLPLKKELCPYNLAPTTSTGIQLIFGDILTVALMEKKNFSLIDYAINHPMGAIGKQITLKVEDLMIRDLPISEENDLLKDVLTVFSEKKCGCILILNEKKNLKGIFTDGDLRRLIQKNEDFLDKKLKDLMIKKPLFIEKDSLALDALKKMQNVKQITVLPVVQNARVVGLIRLHDIIQSGLSSLIEK